MSGPTQPLLSFAYVSSGIVTVGGAPLFKFDASGNWKMAPGFAAPGSGAFPSGNFWVRKVGITVTGSSGAWAIIGHSGANGDWTSEAVLSGNSKDVDFFEDAAPLFTAGDYFDCHPSVNDPSMVVDLAFWWTPAP